MGANDTAEQLQAAQAECVRLEQQLARAEAVIDGARAVAEINEREYPKQRLQQVGAILATYPTSAAQPTEGEA